MYFTRELKTAPHDADVVRDSSASSKQQESPGSDRGAFEGAYAGAAGDAARGGSGLLMRSGLGSDSNASARVIALSRAQQTRGNRYAQRLVAQRQRSANAIQRQCACGGTCAKCSGEEPQVIQAQSTGMSSAANGLMRDVIPSGDGQALDPSTRRFMEQRFGTDFSDVRVHTDAAASSSADALQANAFTTGRDIYFGPGKYSPESEEGRHLLAHELTHVRQQSAGQTPDRVEASPDGQVVVSSPTDRLEAEAEKHADTVMQGGPVNSAVTPDSSGEIQRDEWKGVTDNPIANTLKGVAEKGANYAISQIEIFAPGAVAFFRNIRDYFKNAIEKGVDGLFGGLLGNIREKGLVATLAEMAGGFASGAIRAIGGFVSGQCAAMGQLAEYVLDLAKKLGSGVLEDVKKGFDEIRATLDALWTEYGAPALDWVKKKLSAIWKDVEETAGKIWAALKPLRDAASEVWNAVTDFLAESRRDYNAWMEGFVKKALDAWEDVKAKIKPYMGYVKTGAKVVGGIVLLLSPAGPFIVIGAIVYGLYRGVKALWDKWGKGFTKSAREWWVNDGLPSVQNTIKNFKAKVESAKSTIEAGLQQVYDVFMQILGALGVLTFLGAVKRVFDKVAAKVSEFKDAVVKQIGKWGEQLKQLVAKADPYLQQIKEALRQSLLVALVGPMAFLDDGVWNTINRFVALVMKTPCLREIGGLLAVPSAVQRLGRVREGIKQGWEAVKNPDPLLQKLKNAIAPMVAKIEPAVLGRVSTISSEAGGGSGAQAPNQGIKAPPATAGIQQTGAPKPALAPATTPVTPAPKTPEDAAKEEAAKQRREYDERMAKAAALSADSMFSQREIFIQMSIMHYLSASLAELASSWWEQLMKIGHDLLWPWPEVAKEFTPMLDDFGDAISLVFDLEMSKAIDKFLSGMRHFNSIAGALSGWFMVASVLIGAALGALGFAFGPAGTATVGAGASAGLAFAEEVGMGLLVIAIATEAAILEKSDFDLKYQNPKMKEEERYTADQEDCKAIAGSLMSVITLGALMLLADVAAKFAKFLWSLVEDIPIVKDLTALLKDAKGKVADFSLKEKPGAPEVPAADTAGAPHDVSGEPPKTADPAEKPADAAAKPDETAGKTEKEGVPKAELEAEVADLKQKAKDPNNVHAKGEGPFDAEMEADGHTFDREKESRNWCRASNDPKCGLDLGGELNTEVDSALEKKAPEAPKIDEPPKVEEAPKVDEPPKAPEEPAKVPDEPAKPADKPPETTPQELRRVRQEEADLRAKHAEEKAALDRQDKQIGDKESAIEELEFERDENLQKQPRTPELDRELRIKNRAIEKTKADLEFSRKSYEADSGQLKQMEDRLAEIDTIKQQYKGDKPWRDVSLNDPDIRKVGLHGELEATTAMEAAGLEPLGKTVKPKEIVLPEDFDAAFQKYKGQTGIDGVYKRTNPVTGEAEYWVVESKTTGAADPKAPKGKGELSDTQSGTQMSDEWIEGNLDKAGLSPADRARLEADLKAGKVKKVYAQTDATGTHFYEIDDVSGSSVKLGKEIKL